MRTTRLVSAAVVVALSGLLSACGGANPGVAALVGDTSISTADVEQDSLDFCDAVAPGLTANAQMVPMSYVRGAVISNLVLRAIADGIAQEYDVTAGTTYHNSVAQAEAQAATFPEESRDAYVRMQSSQAYLQDLVSQAANESLAAEGVTSPTAEETSARANELFMEWTESHDITIDPRYGLRVVDGQFASADTGLSFAKSEVATRLLAQDSEPDWAVSLPSAHRCG